MPLSPGATLGPYSVTGKIGEGGMGEVYRARDTKLDRDVALKVLPQAFTDDPDRLARFEREAKVLASLNHPNIGGIYGLEESEGVKALVLEYIEGPTLADRIKQGPIPVDEALPIARQITEALEAAHDQGIIHRDLKPANIKLKPDGTVKVLDFGLAKALQNEVSADPSESPTLTAAATASGVLMGTAAYMSPEQAKGRTVARATDVWAFGCVFYEMLTGHRPFTGASVSETLVAVLAGNPDFEALPAKVPNTGRRLLRRCLERDPNKRLRDVAEALLLLEEDLAGYSGAQASRTAARQAVSVGSQAVGVSAAVVATSLVVGLAVWNLRPTPEIGRDAFTVVLPDNVTLPAEMRLVAAISPNGRDLVFVGETETTSQLYHRPLDRVDAVPIADTEGAMTPFFSPDGGWVGFKQGDTIRKVGLAGGIAETICELPANPFEDRWTYGMSWSHDDQIWFGHSNTGLYRVSADGGIPELMTTPGEANEGVLGHSAPQPLPDGRGILYQATGSGIPTRVALYVPETDDHVVLAEGSRPWFASTGHVVFAGAGQGTLWAVPFGLDRLEPTGEPVPVREGVRESVFGTTQAYLGMDGTLVYLPDRGPAGARTMVWVDREGNEELIDAPPRGYHAPRLSPDGTRVAVGVRDVGGYDVWIHDLVRGVDEPITNDPEWERFPIWAPGGERVLYHMGNVVHSITANRTADAEAVVSHPERQLFPSSWSRDGRSLLVVDWEVGGPTGFNISIVDVDEERRIKPLLETEYSETSAEVSPDGRWLAYSQNRSGQFQIYVSPFPDVSSQRIQVSSDGGVQPVWSSAGGELFYRQGVDCDESGPPRPDPNEIASFEDCKGMMMMAVSFETEQDFTPGIPEVVFEDSYYMLGGRQFDVADGRRFLMIKPSESAPRELTVIRNWVEELR